MAIQGGHATAAVADNAMIPYGQKTKTIGKAGIYPVPA
jgi:hypothetical protein